MKRYVPTEKDLAAIRWALGPRSPDSDPCRNARDLFEAAMEDEEKTGKDLLGFQAWQRVIEWFNEGVTYAPSTIGKIPISWGTAYTMNRLQAMIAGVMYQQSIWVNDFAEEIDPRPKSYRRLEDWKDHKCGCLNPVALKGWKRCEACWGSLPQRRSRAGRRARATRSR